MIEGYEGERGGAVGAPSELALHGCRHVSPDLDASLCVVDTCTLCI